jgi:hypothetical protein
LAAHDPRTEARAHRARRAWRDPAARAQAIERLHLRRDDPTTPAWEAVLAGAHPLAIWLDSNLPIEALPARFGELTLVSLLASCPLPRSAAWSSPPTSPVC